MFSYYPSSILFDFGAIQIHWYGFLIVVAIIADFFIAKFLLKKYNIPTEILYDFGFYLLIFGIIGARLGHIVSEIGYYFKYPLDMFKIWNGGLAIHGAIFAGIVVVWFFCKNFNRKQKNQFKIDSLIMLDILAPLIALGQAIGRWGNYFNQELFGPPSSLPWAIPISVPNRLIGYENFNFFHPNFLYESLWCLLIFLLLLAVHRVRINNNQDARYKIRKILNTITKKNTIFKLPGIIFFSYLFLYSIERFLIGFLRIDPQPGWLNLRLDQWVSLILIALSIFTLIKLRNKHDPDLA